MYVIKKDNTHEAWNVQKVVTAVNKSAYRAMVKFTQEELDFLCEYVENSARSLGQEAWWLISAWVIGAQGQRKA